MANEGASSPNQHKEKWAVLWQAESKRPEEDVVIKAVPTEVETAVEEGWIPAGSSVMDIGSGRGQIAAWLAASGFTVLGVDIAPVATDLARRQFADSGLQLEFRTLDICLDEPEAARFDVFVDQQCFHVLKDDTLEKRYVENVAAWAKPGARLLLFHKTGRDGEKKKKRKLPAAVEQHVRARFEPEFIIERIAPSAEPLVRATGRIPRRVNPGLVFWMRKR
jgi:cyclopropane fatty-acyl-phospholipid synthase-like methyltransferase